MSRQKLTICCKGLRRISGSEVRIVTFSVSERIEVPQEEYDKLSERRLGELSDCIQGGPNHRTR